MLKKNNIILTSFLTFLLALSSPKLIKAQELQELETLTEVASEANPVEEDTVNETVQTAELTDSTEALTNEVVDIDKDLTSPSQIEEEQTKQLPTENVED